MLQRFVYLEDAIIRITSVCFTHGVPYGHFDQIGDQVDDSVALGGFVWVSCWFALDIENDTVSLGSQCVHVALLLVRRNHGDFRETGAGVVSTN
eukprot:scaffold6518_cov147-Amphora_coffeaeformis.AAC.3